MKKITTTLILLISLFSYSQNYNTSASFYSSTDFSRGFEYRGEWNKMYIALQGESFINKDHNFINWGFAIGGVKRYENFDLLGGARVGFIITEKGSKPSFGLETELDYKINEDVFIGVRCAYDIYYDSVTNKVPVSKNLLRGFLKIGYKF